MMHRPETFDVWRGDAEPIRQFDEKKLRRGEYGRGFYFVDDPDVAMGYGPILDRYRVTLVVPFRSKQFGFIRTVAELAGEKPPGTMERRSRWITDKLVARGYDGVVLSMSTGATYVVAFYPESIERMASPPPPEVPQGEPVRVRARPRGWEPAF